MGDHADTPFPNLMPSRTEKPRERFYLSVMEKQKEEIRLLKLALDDVRNKYEALETFAQHQKELAISRLARVRELEALVYKEA